MLNSTKTWQDDKIKHTAEHIGVISEGALKTLVTEIRKIDMEALIKTITDCWCLKLSSDEVINLIKNHYEK